MAAKQNGGWYWNPSTKSASQYWSSGSGPSSGGGHSGGGGGGGASGGGSPTHSYTPPPPPPPTPRDFLNPRKQNSSDAVGSLFNLGGPSPTAGQSAQLHSQQPGPLLGPPAPKAINPTTTAVSAPKIKDSISPVDKPEVSAKIAHATTKAIQSGADPADLQKAKQFLGAKEFIGYCESFVEHVTGSGWKGTSAIDAWRNQSDKVVKGTQGIQPGDAVYFGPDSSNGFYGHTGVYSGNGQFVSATDNGVKNVDLGRWMQQTGQRLLGYIPMVQRALGVGDQGQGQSHGQQVQGPQQVQASQRPPIGPQMSPQSPNISGMSLPQILQQYGSRLSPDILKKVQGAIAASQGQGQPPQPAPLPPPQVAMMGGQQAAPGNSLATDAIKKRMRRQQGMAV